MFRLIVISTVFFSCSTPINESVDASAEEPDAASILSGCTWRNVNDLGEASPPTSQIDGLWFTTSSGQKFTFNVPPSKGIYLSCLGECFVEAGELEIFIPDQLNFWGSIEVETPVVEQYVIKTGIDTRAVGPLLNCSI